MIGCCKFLPCTLIPIPKLPKIQKDPRENFCSKPKQEETKAKTIKIVRKKEKNDKEFWG
jgi:hypothetical protein